MKIQGLKKSIDGKIILENINVTLQQGQITGLIGRNGVGKTTLFRTITGHYLSDEGQILVEGVDVIKKQENRKHIFYIDEQYSFFANNTLTSIAEYYSFNYPDFDLTRFHELLTQSNLSATLRFRAMSKGMQGLFKMILAICSNAKYLLLDEPFDGLDVIIRKNVVRLLLSHLSDSNQSVVISSHNLRDLEAIVDRALMLKGTTIAQDILLEDFKSKARKIQLVLRDKEIPSWLKKESKAIRIEGRVITVVFNDYSSEIIDKLNALQPVLHEELPLTLEDFFEANLTNEQDYQLIL
ncbi:MAG: ABC transporter ATP-binding protein [Streptococcaceae bacterium]|jgi:ABC-2 type transport system ATP-binding protein|nr:ABC transporter ATP-binding protein [Streptococcaceae bacterium]